VERLPVSCRCEKRLVEVDVIGCPAVTRSDAIRSLVERVDVADDAVTLTVCWAPIVEPDHPLADAIAAIRAATSRVRRGDDIRLIIGGADPTANRDQRLIDLIVEARLAHAHLVTSAGGTVRRMWYGVVSNGCQRG
jgi:hypothetical protein